jgi:hypothetical protein
VLQKQGSYTPLKKTSVHKCRSVEHCLRVCKQEIAEEAVRADSVTAVDRPKGVRGRPWDKGIVFQRRLAGFLFYGLTEYLKYRTSRVVVGVLNVCGLAPRVRCGRGSNGFRFAGSLHCSACGHSGNKDCSDAHSIFEGETRQALSRRLLLKALWESRWTSTMCAWLQRAGSLLSFRNGRCLFNMC